MGEALLQEKMPDKNISSAGVRALVNHQADPNTLEILSEINSIYSAKKKESLVEYREL